MVQVSLNSTKLFNNQLKKYYAYSKCDISKYLNKDISAKAIRQRFLDYFVNDYSHEFVRSSPVVPYCDPSVAFVNAGMNQFKGIFLGTQSASYQKVTNSQKCVRVGGKHNDLNVVGLDGYHHTFFEMLGNWSFGDYFKKEACEMAWKLLTQNYKINKGHLYVTYFGGDTTLGIKPDLECRDIWRNIGVEDDRILPFGLKDNFWEMGATGPCGPSTEIHIDLLGAVNRAKFINKGLPDLTELWNIVCIQYNRNFDGSIEPLPQKHIDTGMGFERLTACLQGKLSNYDTDIFTSILSGIHKVCKIIPEYGGKFGENDWNNLDTNYRVLSDHARMIVVCLGDGVIPEQNQKLRRMMRRVFRLSETDFQQEKGLLKELSNYVVENLGQVYPELEANIKQIHQIIDYEEEVYRSIRKASSSEWEILTKELPQLATLDVIEMPGLIAALKEIKMLPTKTVTPSFAFKLYDTHGLDEETIQKVSKTLGLLFDSRDLQEELNKAKLRSRQQAFVNVNKVYELLKYLQVPLTKNKYKYDYQKENGQYKFSKLPVKLLKVIHNNYLVDFIEPEIECSIVLDKSNFYTEAGGQVSDIGFVKFGNNIFQINGAQNIHGYILHKGVLKSNKKIQVDTLGKLEIDKDFRLDIMKNHTATHLLNSTLKEIKTATCQKSSKVNNKYLNFDVGIFGHKLNLSEIENIENRICDVIKTGVSVNLTKVNSQQLLSMKHVTLVPGEYYPNSDIRVIEIRGPNNFESREPCCGTHVLNTSDIEDFCIIGFKSLGRSTTSLHAVTGQRARLAKDNGKHFLENVENLQKCMNDKIDNPPKLNTAISNLRQQLAFDLEGNEIIPITIKQKCLENLQWINKKIKTTSRDTLTEFVEMEMQNVLDCSTSANKRYLVHYLACSAMMDTVPLQKATNMCEDVPVIVISYSDSTVKARCCVPEKMKSNHFNAEKWLSNSIITAFHSSIQFNKGQDVTLICNMKSKRVNIKDWDTLLKESIRAAEDYAEKHLK